MSNAVSELQLINYEDTLYNPEYSTSATPPSNSSLLDNINNYLSGADNWLQNLNTEINPFNVANNLIVQPTVNTVENNPYLVGLDNMIYSLPGLSSLYQSVEGNTSLGLGGTIIPNTPSTPANTPTELVKTMGTVTGNVISGTAEAAITGINTAVTKALDNIVPGGVPNWNWSLIMLIIVILIILMFIIR